MCLQEQEQTREHSSHETGLKLVVYCHTGCVQNPALQITSVMLGQGCLRALFRKRIPHSLNRTKNVFFLSANSPA